jgi:N-acetylmuramoyl-L-alanine amidase
MKGVSLARRGGHSQWLMVLVGALLAGVVWSKPPVMVKQIRLWTGSVEAQLFIDLSGAAKWKVFSLVEPHRVVIDIDQGQLESALPKPSEGGWLRGMRSGHPIPGVLRLVVDLDRKAQIEPVLLPPIGGHGYRLLIALRAKAGRESTPPIASPSDYLVVIDPGHGGDDPGAIGAKGTQEKSVVLKIAKRLARMVNLEPGMRALLTRSRDHYISLRARRTLASETDAMVFVSIHADAFDRASAKGTSVYALSRRGATSALAARLAKVENAADLAGGVSLKDKSPDVAEAMLDMSLDRQIKQSRQLGAAVLAMLGRVGERHSVRVEQAGFAVLKAPQVPSVLVESGYITNLGEESKLRSVLYREQIAGAILGGIKQYCRDQPECPLPPERKVHVVQAGESLSLIGARYGIGVNDLKGQNGLTSDLIRVDQRLRLP